MTESYRYPSPNNPTRRSRRRFLKQGLASAAAAVTLPSLIPGRALGLDGQVSANERIIMGGIGVGRRGRVDLAVLLQEPVVQFVCDADVQKSRREDVKQDVDTAYGNNDCVIYSDMFEVLGRDDVDAVLIATGDRWHTMGAVCAAKAGKDIYSEKPCSLTIEESQLLADTINRYGRIYQAGTQRRNIGNFELAVEMAQTGKLGKLTTVHANTLNPATTQTWLPEEPLPSKDECDWDRWLGPCPWRPYNAQYVAGRWRGHFDFHGGGILEWGTHTVDLCQWANQSDDTAPVEYVPQGNEVHCQYANGVKLVMRDKGWLGLGTCSVRFEGTDGWVETGDSGAMQVGPESLLSEKKVFTERGTTPTNHLREFLECVKTRRQPKANASVAAESHIVCHAAYIAWQLGRKLTFDPAIDEFVDDAEANRMRCRARREPWHA